MQCVPCYLIAFHRLHSQLSILIYVFVCMLTRTHIVIIVLFRHLQLMKYCLLTCNSNTNREWPVFDKAVLCSFVPFAYWWKWWLCGFVAFAVKMMVYFVDWICSCSKWWTMIAPETKPEENSANHYSSSSSSATQALQPFCATFRILDTEFIMNCWCSHCNSQIRKDLCSSCVCEVVTVLIVVNLL